MRAWVPAVRYSGTAHCRVGCRGQRTGTLKCYRRTSMQTQKSAIATPNRMRNSLFHCLEAKQTKTGYQAQFESQRGRFCADPSAICQLPVHERWDPWGNKVRVVETSKPVPTCSRSTASPCAAPGRPTCTPSLHKRLLYGLSHLLHPPDGKQRRQRADLAATYSRPSQGLIADGYGPNATPHSRLQQFLKVTTRHRRTNMHPLVGTRYCCVCVRTLDSEASAFESAYNELYQRSACLKRAIAMQKFVPLT